MDHLHIPPGCLPNVREIPYLGLAPKYDRLGFDGFPERHGRNSDELIASHSILQLRAEWIESFIQEWLWFGLLDEFSKACGIVINLEGFIVDSTSGSGKIISTASLYDVYARRLAVRKLDVCALSLSLDMGDLVRLPHNPAEEPGAQIMDLWIRKMEHGMLSTEISVAQALEKLNRPHGEDAITTDENGIPVPLDTLRQRIVASRCFISSITKTPLPEPKLHSKREKFAESMTRAQRILRTVMYQLDPILRLDIIVSIDILCHTLAKIIDVILDEPVMLYSPNFCEAFEKIMIERNWCPSRISELANSDNTPLAYVASLLPSFEMSSHRGCRPRKCLKLPSSTEAMIRAHREGCDQNCLPTMIPELELVSIWNKGGIPGVRRASSSQDIVEVVDCASRSFIAISHVWAHGLGNPERNEIPSCQFHFLCELVRELGGDEAVLWIDTLVVPNDDKDAKRLAISKLRKIYSEASKVLVIDKDLLRVGPDQTEQIMQLLGSEWQRRLWTLQEGRLARDLFIQFKEGPVPVSELIAKRPLTEFTSLNSEIFNFSLMLKEDMKLRFSRFENGQSDFTALTEDLAFRSVTYKKDEPICLATLLNLSLEDYDQDPTMEDIYRSLPTIPQDWLFLKQQRLQVYGLTWAPSTFLETEFVTFMRGSQVPLPGRRVPEGLIITKDCLLLNNDLDFRRVRSNPSEIYIITTSRGQEFAVEADNIISPEGQIIHIESSRIIKNPAVIWEKPHSFWAVDGSNRKTSSAVLVSRSFYREGITYCKFEMGLKGWHVRDEHKDFHQRMVRNSGGIIDRVSAEPKENMAFCVG